MSGKDVILDPETNRYIQLSTSKTNPLHRYIRMYLKGDRSFLKMFSKEDLLKFLKFMRIHFGRNIFQINGRNQSTLSNKKEKSVVNVKGKGSGGISGRNRSIVREKDASTDTNISDKKKTREIAEKKEALENDAVETIQKVFRGSQGRAKAKKAAASLVKIQSIVRKKQQQKRFQKEKEAVGTIQRVFRGSLGRNIALDARKAVEKEALEKNAIQHVQRL